MMLTLSNFRLNLDHGYTIEIDALNVIWKMHHLSDFLGFAYDVHSQTATLSWRYYSSNGPTDPKYPFERFDLVFHKTHYFEITPRDPAMPSDEDRTSDTISFMMASDETSKYIVNDREGPPYGLIPCFDPDTMEGDYHIFFRFRGGQTIRIGAATAEFVLVQPETSM